MGLFSSLKALAGEQLIDYSLYSQDIQETFLQCEKLSKIPLTNTELHDYDKNLVLSGNSIKEVDEDTLKKQHISLEKYLKENSADWKGIMKTIKNIVDSGKEPKFDINSPMDDDIHTLYTAFCILISIMNVQKRTSAKFWLIRSPRDNKSKIVLVGNISYGQLDADIRSVLYPLSKGEYFGELASYLLNADDIKGDFLLEE